MRSLGQAFLLFLAPVVLQSQTPAAAPGTITIGIIDSIYSPTLEEYRRFEVYTPPGYRQSIYAPRTYPVLYLLDGDAHFHSVTGLIQILGTGVNATYVVPEMIVVAIPNTDRTRDLTPTHSMQATGDKPVPGFKTSGGGPSFLRFMKTELIPHIDSVYRTAPYRVLVGHSFGGISAISALYTMPETFNAYVAIDPSLWWDNQVLLKQAKDYFSKPAPPARTLFVGQANTKDPFDTTQNVHFNSIVEFNRLLETSNKSGIRYSYKYYGGDDHGSVPLIAEYDALHFIFAGYKVHFDSVMHQPASIRGHFAKLSATLGYTILPPERMVDQLGQIELGTDTTKAVEFMQLNVELYPKSANAFAMLGKALLAKRDTAHARTALERAVQLAPDSRPIRDLLQSLNGKK